MASSTVNMKLTPFELQVIDEALRTLARVVDIQRMPDAEGDVLGIRVNWDLFNGSPSEAKRAALQVRTDLGLR